MSKKYCENCGAAMPEESKFCTECGTPFPTVKKEDKPAPVPAQSEVQPDQQNGPDAADPLDALMTRPENTPYAEPQQPAQPGQTQFADPGSQPGVQPGVQPIPTVQTAQTGNTGSAAAPYGQTANPAAPAYAAQANSTQNAWGRPAQQSSAQQPTGSAKPIGSAQPIGQYPPAASAASAPAAAYVPGRPGATPAYGANSFSSGEITPEDLKGTPFEPVYAWGWVGIFLLLGIPIVNLVLLIVWACGGCRKNVKKSFARGSLLMVLITAVLFAVIGAAAFYALFPVVEPAINEILEQFGYRIVLG